MKKRSFLLIALSLMAALCLSLFAACGEGNPTENTVSFTISVQGYTGQGVADKTVATGSDFTLPQAPVIEYYEFDYWQLGTEQYKAGDTYTVETDGDITFTAVYAETFVLTYSVAEGQTAPAAQSGRVGTEVTLAEGTDKSEYSEFKSWVIGGTEYEAGAKYTPAHGATTATAAYSDTFVLTYVAEGLTAPDAATGTVGEKVTLPAGPEKADYDFEGWLIDGDLYAAGAEYEPALGVTTATAQYKLAYVYVTFEIEEDSGLTGELPTAPVRVAVDTALDAAQIPELTAPEYYSYAWYIGDEEVELATEVFAENTTVTAKAYYVGWDEETAVEALIFTPVGDSGYTVMASDSFSEYITGGKAYIPASYNGRPVVGITAGTTNENAFGNTVAAGLTTIYLPASITDIGACAFYQNATLTTVVYEKGIQLETIGTNAFRQTTALTTISDSEENTGLRFPASVKVIGQYAFYGIAPNQRVVNVYFDEKDGQLTTIETYAFAATGQTLAASGGITLNTAFPSTLKVIAERAFYCNILGRIDFGENATITTIGEHAFSNTGSVDVSTVTEIIIPKSVTTLGGHIFQNSQHLAYVEFEEGSGIDTIPEYMFSGCAALEEVVFPAGLTTIEQSAFASCFTAVNGGAGVALNTEGGFIIPASVTVYDTNVFNGSYFTEIVIPNTVTEIDAFNGARFSAITFAEGGTEALVIGSNAFRTTKAFPVEVTIPARVTSIAARAFWQLNITELTFEDGDMPLEIADYAFNAFNADSGKASLSGGTSAANVLYAFTADTVALPARLTKLGVGAFQGQANIKTLTFAENIGITEIPDYAFAYCSSLESVNVPEGITSIGQYSYAVYATAFGGTSNLTVGIYDGTLNASGTPQVTNVSIAQSDFYDITSIVIPASVTLVAGHAYYNRGITVSSITFNGTASDEDLIVEDMAFAILNTHANNLKGSGSGNDVLTSVTLPANLVEIGGAFRNAATCLYNALTEIKFAEGSRVKVLATQFMAYSNVKEFEVPASVTEIGNSVFISATLETLTFAAGSQLKKIGDEAFSNTMPANGVVTAANQRMKLTTVTLPNTVEEIGIKPFAGIDTITAINVAEGCAYYESVDGVLYSKGEDATLVMYPFGKEATSFAVKDGVTIIGDHALTGNKHLQTIDFNDVKTAVGERAFSNMVLTSVNHTFESLGNYAFGVATVNDSTLLSANINITGGTLPTYLFQNCSTLTEVTLGSGFSSVIPTSTFAGCSKLATVHLPSTITELQGNAFQNCTSITSLDFSKVTTLGTNAFQGCTSLTEVKLGAITTIGVNTFANTNLTGLTLTSETVVTLGNVNAFTGYSADKPLTIYVPEDLVASYQTATTWVTLVTNGSITFAAITADAQD